jgi:hypothetical protein
VRKERKARRWTCLDGVTHEVFVVVEKRSEICCEKSHTELMRTGRSLETDPHTSAGASISSTTLATATGSSGRGTTASATIAAALTSTGSGPGTTRSSGTGPCRTTAISSPAIGAAPASAAVVTAATPAAALPVDQLNPLTIEQHFNLLAFHRPKSRWRHVVSKDRCDRDLVLAF